MACFPLVLLQDGAVLTRSQRNARMLLSIRLTDSGAANVSAWMNSHWTQARAARYIDAWLTLSTVPGQSR